jgi:hypothetical protein
MDLARRRQTRAKCAAEKRFFRKSFLLPEDATISAASLRISADDKFTVWLNGRILALRPTGAQANSSMTSRDSSTEAAMCSQ